MLSKEQTLDNASFYELLNSIVSRSASLDDVIHFNEQEISVSSLPVSSVDRKIDEHVDYLEQHYRFRLVSMIYHEAFFPGESNETIAFVSSLRRYTDVALEKWVNKLYGDYFNTPIVLRGLLYIILYFNDVFNATIANVATAAVANKSCEIQELGVRMLESHCCRRHLEILKGIKRQEPWLQEYIDQVKSDFEKQLCQF